MNLEGNRALTVEIRGEDSSSEQTWNIAEEFPVALRFNGGVYAVMLASPADLEDFALGFALSEKIVAKADELQSVKVAHLEKGIELDITISAKRAERLAASERRRAIAGNSGCGLCGVQSIDEVTGELPEVLSSAPFSESAIRRAINDFASQQRLNQLNHSVHGAAFATSEGEIVCMREDVGRHNALDKLIGAIARGGIDPASGFLVISSRAGYELIHKAALAGVPILVSISAPTTMALAAAEQSAITLASLSDDGLVIFTNGERIESQVIVI